MVLRKITIDNSVRYNPKSEKKTKEKENKPKTIKAGSLPRKQSKKFLKNSKKFVNGFTARGFGVLTK